MQTSYDLAIDMRATGQNIRRLRLEQGYSVKDVQDYFGFETARAIYKWQKGETLPTVDNLLMLGHLFDVPLEQILVLRGYDAGPSSASSRSPSGSVSDDFIAES